MIFQTSKYTIRTSLYLFNVAAAAALIKNPEILRGLLTTALHECGGIELRLDEKNKEVSSKVIRQFSA